MLDLSEGTYGPCPKSHLTEIPSVPSNCRAFDLTSNSLLVTVSCKMPEKKNLLSSQVEEAVNPSHNTGRERSYVYRKYELCGKSS